MQHQKSLFPLFALFLLSVVPCALQAGEFDAVDPAKLGLNVEKLAEIDALLNEKIKEGSLVGAMTLVVKDNQVAYFKMWGDADREKSLPMKEDTIFRIYSMSKPITSTAIMMLVEQGKIDLDAPVSDYLPELKEMSVLVTKKDALGKETFQEVPADRPMTTRDLLRHTSGFTYGFFGNSEVDKRYLRAGVLRGKNIEGTVTKLSQIPLKHQPGTQFEYSVSTDVLGRLVEVVSSQRFDHFLSKNIFEPLGMEDTFFTVPKDKQHRFAQMYSASTGKSLVPANARRSTRFVDEENEFHSGGGGLCSTTKDYLTFCKMLLNGGQLKGTRILKAKTVKEMRTNQLGPDVDRRRGFQFGLGFAVTPRGEFGWGGAAGTKFWINHKQNLIGIYMTQINPNGGHNFGGQVKKIVIESLEK